MKDLRLSGGLPADSNQRQHWLGEGNGRRAAFLGHHSSAAPYTAAGLALRLKYVAAVAMVLTMLTSLARESV